jgi:polysaccharide biosynthesis transport protein
MAGRLQGSPNEPDVIDGREVLAVLRRRKWTVAGTSLIVTVCASIVLTLLPSRYKAVALVLVDPRGSQIVQLHTPVSNLSLTADSGLVKTEVGILGSDDIMRRVVTRMKLFDRPEFQKTPGILERAEGAFRDGLSKLVLDVSGGLPAPEGRGAQISESQAIANAVDIYRHALSVSNSEGSSLIQLSFEATDPELATAIVREHAAVYLEQKKNAQDAANRQAATWFKEQRGLLEARLRDTEQEAQQFREQNNIVSTGTTTAVVQRLAELNTELLKAEGDRSQLEASIEQLHRVGAIPGGIFAVPEVLASHLIESYRMQEADLLQRQAELLQQYGPRHPKVIEINAQIENLKAKIAREVGRIANGLSNQMSAADARVAALKGDYDRVERQTTLQEQAVVKLQALDKEAASLRRLDETLFSQEKETVASAQLEVPYAQVISPPSLQQGGGVRKLFLIGAIAGGSLFLGIIVAFLRERLDDGLRSLDEAEEVFGVAGLGGIPLVPRARGSRLVPCDDVIQRPTSLYAERVRTLSRSIEGWPNDGARVVLVTSALPGEGKTSLSVSLGRSLARTGKLVLMIEGDLRRPSLSKVLLPTDTQGPDLADCLSGHATFQDCVRSDPKSPLQYLAVRDPPVVPQDLLESDTMRRMVRAARQEYDYILIDSPPVAAVSDALILARVVDVILLVVRWNHTSKSLIHSTLSRLRQETLPPIRLVLSKIDVRKRAAFRHGDFEYYLHKTNYYYGRRYRSDAGSRR